MKRKEKENRKAREEEKRSGMEMGARGEGNK